MRAGSGGRSEIVLGSWTGGFAGSGQVKVGSVSCSIAAPCAIGGGGVGVTPSTLLVGAASACYLLTLAGTLEALGIRVVSISIETEGLFRGSVPPELVAVTHRPTVVVGATDDSQLVSVRRGFEMAKASCMASRAMPAVTVTVEGTATAASDRLGAIAEIPGGEQ